MSGKRDDSDNGLFQTETGTSYDLPGVILPGLLGVFGVWVLLKGWTPFVISLHELKGTEFTVLLIVAFGSGKFVAGTWGFEYQDPQGKEVYKEISGRFLV